MGAAARDTATHVVLESKIVFRIPEGTVMSEWHTINVQLIQCPLFFPIGDGNRRVRLAICLRENKPERTENETATNADNHVLFRHLFPESR